MNSIRFKNLNIEDIKNKYNFINWIKSSIKLYSNEQDVPNSDLLIYLDYIDGIIDNNQEIDKIIWKKNLNDIRNKIISNDKL